MREGNFRISNKEKALILLSFVFIFTILFIPLWQLGVNRSLEMKIRASEIILSDLSEEERRVRLAYAEEEVNIESEIVLSEVQRNSRDYANLMEI